MQTAQRKLFQSRPTSVSMTQVEEDSPRRGEIEAFIREVFARHYDARVTAFAPHLLAYEQQGRVVAAAGWRDASREPLFLEHYLDSPIEVLLTHLFDRSVARERIVEVGNLASEKPGGSLDIILDLAARLDRLGYEWVVFTATRELIGMFARLGLPLLVLNKADPARLGADAAAWGRYYDTGPIVVAGRIRIGLDRMGKARGQS
jgi:hypothetical protein